MAQPSSALSLPGCTALILGASVFWGFTGTLQALGPSGISPLALGEVRITLGGAVLLLLVFLREGPGVLRGIGPWKSVLLASGGLGFYQLFFFAGVLSTGVALGTVLALGSGPLWGGLLARVFLKEPLSLRWGTATALGVLGCILLVGSQGPMEVHWGGVGLSLAAGLACAVMGMGMKGLCHHRSPLGVVGVCMALGALFFSPIYFMAPLEWFWQPRGFLVAFALGAACTALPYSMYTLGLRVVPLSTAYTLTLVEPLTASLLGVFFLKEPMGFWGFVGMGLLFMGLGILSCPWGRRWKSRAVPL